MVIASFLQDRDFIDACYLVASVLFILGIRGLSHPRTARQGNVLASVGMLIAVVATLLDPHIENFGLIILGIVIGSVIGAVSARTVKMTAMPQMVALFNGVGGGAAALIALAEFHNRAPEAGRVGADESVAILLSALIGGVSFAGSLVAFAKLQELVSGRPITYPGQKLVNGVLLAAAAAAGIAILAGAEEEWLLGALLGGALLFGVLFVLPIGGADMPVVISLLNAFTGI